MMLDLFNFIKHVITPDTMVPFLFVLLGLYLKMVIMPWNRYFEEIIEYVQSVKRVEEEQFNSVAKNITNINKNITDRGSSCSANIAIQIENTKKILDEIKYITAAIDNMVNRLEKMKDDSKDNKIDLNQQLYSIKQEISDLKSKIEPLTYISRGIK